MWVSVEVGLPETWDSRDRRFESGDDERDGPCSGPGLFYLLPINELLQPTSTKE